MSTTLLNENHVHLSTLADVAASIPAAPLAVDSGSGSPPLLPGAEHMLTTKLVQAKQVKDLSAALGSFLETHLSSLSAHQQVQIAGHVLETIQKNVLSQVTHSPVIFDPRVEHVPIPAPKKPREDDHASVVPLSLSSPAKRFKINSPLSDGDESDASDLDAVGVNSVEVPEQQNSLAQPMSLSSVRQPEGSLAHRVRMAADLPTLSQLVTQEVSRIRQVTCGDVFDAYGSAILAVSHAGPSSTSAAPAVQNMVRLQTLGHQCAVFVMGLTGERLNALARNVTANLHPNLATHATIAQKITSHYCKCVQDIIKALNNLLIANAAPVAHSVAVSKAALMKFTTCVQRASANK